MKPSIQIGVRSKIEKISAGSFNSDDVKLIYIDLRDYAGSGSITREIGDYIAHPKAKDRGISHARTSEQFAAFNKMGDLISGRLPGQSVSIVVKPAFNGIDIVEDLIIQLKHAMGITEKTQGGLRSQVVGLCASVIAILQDAILKVGKERLTAHAGYSEGKLNLFVSYPVDFGGRVIPAIAVLVEGVGDPLLSTQTQLFNGTPFAVEVAKGVMTLIPGS
jgi:hypothetical protein